MAVFATSRHCVATVFYTVLLFVYNNKIYYFLIVCEVYDLDTTF